MPLSYTIDVRGHIVYGRGWAEVTEADIVNIRERLTTDSQFSPTFMQLLDLSEVTSLGIRWANVRSLVSEDPFDASARRAIVAPATAVYGSTRMYELYAEESMPNISVFRTAEEAGRWLGLEEE